VSNTDIILAWKDEDYLSGLTPEERAALPDSPVGVYEVPDAETLDAQHMPILTVTFLGCSLDCTYGSCVTVCPEAAVYA
jgi:mersacidin/lichenicidin family type 2 lantibiotic